MKLTSLPAIIALAALAACAPAFARSNGPAGAKDQQSTAHEDTKFLKEATQGNVNEIALAEVVLKKTQNDDVKGFAEKMIHDHNMLIENMKPFAQQAGLERPEHPDAATEALKLKFDALTGASLDKAYIKAMVEDHHKDLQEFQKEIKSTGYPAFRTAVEDGSKVVREHLEMIDGIAKKNGIPPAPVSGE